MTPEEIAALIAKAVADATKPLADQITSMRASSTAADKAALDKAAADQAIVDKAAADKAAAEKAASDAAKGVTPEVNSMLAEFKRKQEASDKQIAALTKSNEEGAARVLEAEKKSAVDQALNGFQFATPKARDTAFSMLSGEVKRDANGVLTAGDNLTPEAFVKTFLPEQHPYLLAPEVRGGSGAGTGSSAGQRGKVATLEMMSPDNADWAKDRVAVAAQINSVLAELQGKK